MRVCLGVPVLTESQTNLRMFRSAERFLHMGQLQDYVLRE